MPQTIIVVPTHHGVGTTSVCLGLLRACQRTSINTAFLKPIAQPGPTSNERSAELVRQVSTLQPPEPIAWEDAEQLLSKGNDQVLLEKVVALHSQINDEADVTLVEGLVPSNDFAYADKLNEAVARALNAQVILVTAPDSNGSNQYDVTDHLVITAQGYDKSGRILGCIVNKITIPLTDTTRQLDASLGEAPAVNAQALADVVEPIRENLLAEGLTLLAAIPAYPQFTWLRAHDIAQQLNALVLYGGEAKQRRIVDIRIIARTLANSIEAFADGTLIITPGDREDILLAVSLSTLGGTRFAGLLLTGGLAASDSIMALCKPAFESGLPVFSVESNSFQTANQVVNLNRDVPVDDVQRVELVMNTVANYIEPRDLVSIGSSNSEPRLSPPAFRHRLIIRASARKRRIVLPEGDEPRTIRAAAICAQRGIANCILLGNPEKISEIATRHGVSLPDSITVINPSDVLESYVSSLVSLRKHKRMTKAVAREALTDRVMLGTMMLYHDEVDGLVSGAVNTTANTIRPALQLIKTAPNASLVSSVFFMCLPDQMVVYGDCAVNPEPNAEQLADIALQSADSAEAFGIPARVAMISYSTGDSGSGAEVERVREATRIAKRRRPDLIIDGPLQYDAASIESVAKSKAPNSPVAGRATVFIFPDLNTGNTTYKAVQRSAGVVSIGPMLQGMAKPVNDLSRGALVEDVVYTIAITAIQAGAISN